MFEKRVPCYCLRDFLSSKSPCWGRSYLTTFMFHPLHSAELCISEVKQLLFKFSVKFFGKYTFDAFKMTPLNGQIGNISLYCFPFHSFLQRKCVISPALSTCWFYMSSNGQTLTWYHAHTCIGWDDFFTTYCLPVIERSLHVWETTRF